MNVVLPAPFGPSSPVTPCPISTESRSRATVERYCFVTPTALTIADESTVTRPSVGRSHVERRVPSAVTRPVGRSIPSIVPGRVVRRAGRVRAVFGIA